MPSEAAAHGTISVFDAATRALVGLSAVLADGGKAAVRTELQVAAKSVSHQWVEEPLLQT